MAPVLRVIAALRQVDDRGTSCTLSRHCYMIYGATWKDLSMEKRPCSRGVGVYHSQESLKVLSRRYGMHPQTVAKWQQRTHGTDAPMGLTPPQATVLTQVPAARSVACRRHTLRPLDAGLSALQATLPHLTRSALHRC
jgi:hypothetical protein